MKVMAACRSPALRVGEAQRIDTVTAEDLRAFAAELRRMGAGSPKLERAVEAVSANARRLAEVA